MSLYDLNDEMDEMPQRLRKWLSQLSRYRLSSCFSSKSNWIPSADIHETQEAYHVFIDLAGIEPSCIQLVVEGNLLHLRGERKRPQVNARTRIHQIEIDFGKFQRTFHFPVRLDSDGAQSSYRNGFLEIVLPKFQKSVSVRVPLQHD